MKLFIITVFSAIAILNIGCQKEQNIKSNLGLNEIQSAKSGGGSSINISSGLVANYPFSGNANDATKNRNNGRVFGASLTTDRKGKRNSAYIFNGTDNYIEVNDNPTLVFRDGFSISFWSYFTNTQGGWFGFVNKDNWFNSSGIMSFASFGNFGFGPIGNQTGTGLGCNILDNNWNFICYTNLNGIAKLYKNGILVATGIIPIVNNNSTLLFGARHDNNGVGQTNYMPGKLDEIKIWNRALLDNEINYIYTH
jgi:hypothetical protein